MKPDLAKEGSVCPLSCLWQLEIETGGHKEPEGKRHVIVPILKSKCREAGNIKR